MPDPVLDALLADLGGRVELLERDLRGAVQVADAAHLWPGGPPEAGEYASQLRAALSAVRFMSRPLRRQIARARRKGEVA